MRPCSRFEYYCFVVMWFIIYRFAVVTSVARVNLFVNVLLVFALRALGTRTVRCCGNCCYVRFRMQFLVAFLYQAMHHSQFINACEKR